MDRIITVCLITKNDPYYTIEKLQTLNEGANAPRLVILGGNELVQLRLQLDRVPALGPFSASLKLYHEIAGRTDRRDQRATSVGIWMGKGIASIVAFINRLFLGTKHAAVATSPSRFIRA
jgi:hypothetical protein